MPINSLKPRLAQVGAIRLGEQKINPKTNKPFPAKLANFRITTPSKRIADDIAELFKGEPRPWRNGNSPEWEVYTSTSEIRVVVPPQLVDPNMEMWGPGMMVRLCDDTTERMRGIPCMCRAEFGDDFSKTAPKLKVCKVTFRVSLMIYDLQSAGTFKLEAHGWNSAAEMPELVNTISQAKRALPGTLLLVQRSKSILHPNAAPDKQIENRNWVEPRLDIDILTAGQMYSPQLETIVRQQLSAGPGVERPALAAAPTSTPWTPERVIAAAGHIDNVPELQALWSAASADGALTDEVKKALTARSEVVKPKPAKAAPVAAAKTKREPQPPAAEIVDAELVDEPVVDGKQAWTECVDLAGQRGWNMPALAGKFAGRYGFDYRDDKASDAVLVEFRNAIISGEVQ